MQRLVRWFGLGLAAMALAACHKHGEPPAAPAKAASAAPASTHAAPRAPAPAASSKAAASTPAVAADVFRVTGLRVGSLIDPVSYAVTTTTDRFSPDVSTLYASVATEGRTPQAALAAHWRYLEGQGVVVNDLSQNVSADGAAITTFKVRNPNRWPSGHYRVEITLDGKPVAQQDFEIGEGKSKESKPGAAK